MTRAMIRQYRRYKLHGTEIHVMTAAPIEALILAFDSSGSSDWVLEGVYDVEMIKDREESIRVDTMKGMRELVATARQANQEVDC